MTLPWSEGVPSHLQTRTHRLRRAAANKPRTKAAPAPGAGTKRSSMARSRAFEMLVHGVVVRPVIDPDGAGAKETALPRSGAAALEPVNIDETWKPFIEKA